MVRYALAIGLLCCPAQLYAGDLRETGGKWSVDDRYGDAEYLIASSGASGDFLVCFEAGTVRTVKVAVGQEQSQLSRGACTVFAPTQDNGIVLDTPGRGAREAPGIALGTFRVIRPAVTRD
jgi:hypothetical protein